jgi:ubiquitin C-terminal hydrolase
MPSDQSQAAFQDAVKAVFSQEGASRYKRARLRDRLANKVLPEWLATALKNGSQQLDGAEFTTFLLDEIVPENNQLTDTSEIKVEGYETFSKAEKQTKLELPLTRTGNGSGAIKCSEMLKNYCEVEKLDGENQYDLYGTKVNATKTLKPQVSNHDSDVVVSIKRFGTQKTGKKKPHMEKLLMKLLGLGLAMMLNLISLSLRT